MRAAFTGLASLPLVHQRLSRTFDVLMTGAVLGGGSDALHQLVLVFTHFFQSAAGRVKGEAMQGWRSCRLRQAALCLCAGECTNEKPKEMLHLFGFSGVANASGFNIFATPALDRLRTMVSTTPRRRVSQTLPSRGVNVPFGGLRPVTKTMHDEAFSRSKFR